MGKIVVTSEDVSSVENTQPVEFACAQLPAAIPAVFRFLLAPLVFLLPVLSLVTVFIMVGTLRKDPRIRHAWIQYCCILLVISGLFSSLAAGLVFFLLGTPVPQPAIHFSLDAPVDLPSASTVTLSSSELASRVAEVVFIVTRDNKLVTPTKETLAYSGFGTGVLLFAGENEYLFATSRHVIDGESWKTEKPFNGNVVLMDREGGFSRAQIAGRHKVLDMMLLRLPRVVGSKRFAQPVLDFENVALGERIMTFGHPEGLFFSLSDGLVSRKDPAGLIQITAPVSPGASGGPVYDLQGQLLGIVSGMVNKQTSPHSENLNFAVRADCLLHTEQWQMEPSGKAALDKYVAACSTNITAHSTPKNNQ